MKKLLSSIILICVALCCFIACDRSSQNVIESSSDNETSVVTATASNIPVATNPVNTAPESSMDNKTSVVTATPSNSPIPTFGQVNTEENVKRYDGIMLVCNQKIALPQCFVERDDYSYIEIPVIKLLEALGSKLEWKDDNVAEFSLVDKTYILDTVNNTLCEKGSNSNLLIPPPGSKHGTICRGTGNDFTVDDNSLALLFRMAGLRHVGYEGRLLKIDFATNFNTLQSNVKKSAFDVLSVGMSLSDVQAIDPDGLYLFLITGRVDNPKISSHYTKDGYLITVKYDEDYIITEIITSEAHSFIVNGVVIDTYYTKIHYAENSTYADIPFVALYEALGASFKWQNNKLAEMTYNGKQYILDLEKVSLTEPESELNIIHSADGGTRTYKVLDREIILDSVTVKSASGFLGNMIDFSFDDDSKTVYATER